MIIRLNLLYRLFATHIYIFQTLSRSIALSLLCIAAAVLLLLLFTINRSIDNTENEIVSDE